MEMLLDVVINQHVKGLKYHQHTWIMETDQQVDRQWERGQAEGEAWTPNNRVWNCFCPQSE